VLKLVLPGRFDRVAVVLYLLLGWSGVMVYGSVIASLPSVTLWLLAAGGVLYSIGVIFHLWRSLRFQNAIWHCECPFWLGHKIKSRHWATAACQRPLRASRLWRLIQTSRFLLRWLVLWLFANFSFALPRFSGCWSGIRQTPEQNRNTVHHHRRQQRHSPRRRCLRVRPHLGCPLRFPGSWRRE
jgi:hypothetical protein